MAAIPSTDSGLDLSWLNPYDEPTSASSGKKGLTLKEVNLGRYADAARGAGDMTYRMRGGGCPAGRPALRHQLPVKGRRVVRELRHAL
jgi:hypothetical protein